MPIQLYDAPPQLLISPAILFFAGNPVELCDPHNGMQAFPTRLGYFEELLPGQRGIDVIASERLSVLAARGKLLRNSQRQLQVTFLASAAMEHTQGMDRSQIHLRAAGVDKPRALKFLAK